MKLICFDLDGTLISSDKAHYRAYNKALVELGLKKISFDKMAKHSGAPKIEMAKALTNSKDKKILQKITNLHAKYLFKEAIKDSRKIKGVVPILRKLKKTYKLGLLSNNKHSNILNLIKATNLDKNIFDVIIGNDDVNHSKPYPDEILKAEKLLHLDADYIVGDSIYDIMAGKRAKTKTISVLTGGYSRKQLKKYKPDHIIGSVRDILKILK